jgi:hypothetical protein
VPIVAVPDVRDAVEPRLDPGADLRLADQPPAARLGTRGMSKTQSSVKKDMIASTSWALNASRNAGRDGVGDVTSSSSGSERRAWRQPPASCKAAGA